MAFDVSEAAGIGLMVTAFASAVWHARRWTPLGSRNAGGTRRT